MTSLKEAFAESKDQTADNSASIELDVPIKLFGNEKDKNRLAGIINRIAKSELGKETLEIAADAGYTISFIDGTGGTCDYTKKELYLGEKHNDNLLVSVLAHEARHAGQFVRCEDLDDQEHNNIKAQIMISRAEEADADRAACAVCYELKHEHGDDKAYNHFAMFNKHITRPYEEAIKNGENPDAAAFKGWYHHRQTKAMYEYACQEYILDQIQEIGKEGEMMLDKGYSGNEIADKLCFSKDEKNYLREDASYLEEGVYVDITVRTKDYLKDFMEKREKKHGLAPDKSIDDLPVRLDRSGFHRLGRNNSEKNNSGASAEHVTKSAKMATRRRFEEALAIRAKISR